MSDVGAIYEVMNAVKRDVGHIGKDDRNTHFNFNFRGIDAVMNAFHQPMVDHGLVVVPSYEDAVYQQVGDAIRCQVAVRLTFYAPDGSFVEAVGRGEAIDRQDKATPQAMQQAFKYTLLQAFSVPTQDMEDSDAKGPVEAQDWHTSLRELLSKVPWPDEFDDDDEDVHQAAALSKMTKGAASVISDLSDEQAQWIASKLRTSNAREKFVEYAIEAAQGDDQSSDGTGSSGEGTAGPSDTPPEPSDGERLWADVQGLWRKLAIQGPRVLTHARMIVDQDELDGADGKVEWTSWNELGPDAHPQVLRGLKSWLEDHQAKAGAA